jgi:hypothetical protein
MHVLLLPRFPYSVIYLCWKASERNQEADLSESNIDCNEGMAGFLLNEQDENGMDTTVLIAGRSMFLTDCAKVGVE